LTGWQHFNPIHMKVIVFFSDRYTETTQDVLSSNSWYKFTGMNQKPRGD